MGQPGMEARELARPCLTVRKMAHQAIIVILVIETNMCVKNEYLQDFIGSNTKKTSKAGTTRGMNWKYPMYIYIFTDQMGYISGES